MLEEGRRHYLDGIRAIAALLIVFHHAFTSNIIQVLDKFNLHSISYFLLNFTQSGVELFFVLSGIVILTPFLRKKKNFNVRQYFVRRVTRIYPPYLGALLFGTIVIWLNTFYPTWYSQILMPFSWKATFNQLAIFNFSNSYYNLAWWSLQIELLFYLLIPVVILLYPYFPKSYNKIVLLVIALLLVGFGVQLYLNDSWPELYGVKNVQLNIIKFFDYPLCFLLGIYIAGENFSIKQGFILSVMGILLILFSYMFLPFTHSGYGLLYAGLIIITFNTDKIKYYLSHPLLVWIGERSYSLFLIHFSVFYLINYLVSYITPERNLVYGALTRLTGVPVAILISMCLFYFIERRQAKGLITANYFWPVFSREKLKY